jgi:D-serine deaminase-like pyridoxal phosphate-dependent protein
MHFREVPTPALVIDLDILERNVDRMAAYCRQHGLKLRPHTKTHKTLEVARLQMERGATGLTVAKTGEAEVMAGVEGAEILVAYPILGAEKLKRLAALAKGSSLLMALDSETAARELSAAATAQQATVGVLVEFDAGLGRCGLPPGEPCVALARAVEKLPGLKFRGLMTYPGNLSGLEACRREEAKRVAARLAETLAAFQVSGMAVETVSGGSTPSAFISHQIPGVTEIRPGTYVYNDLNTFYQEACHLEDCAARVVSTVVSNAVAGRAMIDAGSKTLSSDPLGFGPKTGYGRVMEAPDAALFKLNEEHGHLDISRSSHRFRVGEVLTIIPNHVCTCVNMHDEVFLMRNEEVVGLWRVAARGKIR